MMKNRFFGIVFLLILGGGFVFSQEPILLAYQRNFVRASLAAKPGILRDAATDSRSAEFIGALYEFALGFILDNSAILKDDADMITLAGTAARGIGAAGCKEAAETLWSVFLALEDPYSRGEILGALVSFGREPKFIENLNQFITSHNNAFRAGEPPDYTTFSTCVSALASMKDPSSFEPLFSGLTAGYPGRINLEIQKALESLEVNYQLMLGDIIRRNLPGEKRAALELAAAGERLGGQEQGDLAQTALEISMDFVPPDAEAEKDMNDLGYRAIQILTRLKWSRASTLAIRHFYRIQTEFRKNQAIKNRFLEAVTCLGVMGTAESAQVLALQLGYYNSLTESSGNYDYEVIIALVTALGEIGDKAAFDYLLYVNYLNYSEQIQSAAREALNRLKW